MATTFKFYSEKSKARRALVQVHGIPKSDTDAYLYERGDKWGFHMIGDAPVMPDTAEAVNDSAPEQADVSASLGTVAQAVVAALNAADYVEPETEVAPAPSASAFGAFCMSQLTTPPPQPAEPMEPTRVSTAQRVDGLKIEKDRPEQNGVRMPSKGGMCRAVWDAALSMTLHNEATGVADVPSVAQIKALAKEKGWNVNNASIEYYQWRKFHGITGRGKKSV